MSVERKKKVIILSNTVSHELLIFLIFYIPSNDISTVTDMVTTANSPHYRLCIPHYTLLATKLSH